MKLLSVNVGIPREIFWEGRTVRTSIFKDPVRGRVHVGPTNLAGDEQSDLSVHGGRDKAVYAYPSEHYPFWRNQLPGVELPWGVFGENLTTAGVVETGVHVGDRLRVGSAEFVVTQPRMPCFKLGLRFRDPHMVKRFLDANRNGFYLAVVREGELGTGDTFEFIARDERRITIAAIARLYHQDAADPALLRRVIELPALPERWRAHFQKRLEALG